MTYLIKGRARIYIHTMWLKKAMHLLVPSYIYYIFSHCGFQFKCLE